MSLTEFDIVNNMSFNQEQQQQHEQESQQQYPLASSFFPPMPSHDYLRQQQQHLPTAYDPHNKMFSIPPPPPPGASPFNRDPSPPRKRTRTSPEQLAILEKSFTVNPSPNNRVREQLSRQLGMPERSIQIWFQNRRAKVKNQAKRSTSHGHDSTLYMQQQYAASAAAAACQSVAAQNNQTSIDQNLYYYYYYYYFHQQQQQQQQHQQMHVSASSATANDTTSIINDNSTIGTRSTDATPINTPSTVNALIASMSIPSPIDEHGGETNSHTGSHTNNQTANQRHKFSRPMLPPAPSPSYSTPTSAPNNNSWGNNNKQQAPTTIYGSAPAGFIPDLIPSTSTSSSLTSDNYPYHSQHGQRHNYRSSSVASTQEHRTRAQSVGPYTRYSRKSISHERQSSCGPPPSNSTRAAIAATIQSHPMPFSKPDMDSKLCNPSNVIEGSYHIVPTHQQQAGLAKQAKYYLSAQNLKIGTWKRVSDLKCHIDLSARTIVWSINDEQQSFRIEINLNLVQFIKVAAHQVPLEMYRLEFFLGNPREVKFYMTTSQGSWVQCHDFTQDKQASRENVHVIEGFQDPLQIEFLNILMQAPDLQSLLVQEEDEMALDQQLLTTADDINNSNSIEDDGMTSLLLLQSLHLPQN